MIATTPIVPDFVGIGNNPCEPPRIARGFAMIYRWILGFLPAVPDIVPAAPLTWWGDGKGGSDLEIETERESRPSL